MKGGSLGSIVARPSAGQQQGACNCGTPAAQPHTQMQPQALPQVQQQAQPQWGPYRPTGFVPQQQAQPQAQPQWGPYRPTGFVPQQQATQMGGMSNMSGLFRNLGLFG